MQFIHRLTDRFAKVQPLPAGMHHLQASQNETPYRVHLRLRKDGSGLLIVNAATILHLNPTAAEYAFHFIKGTDPVEAARQIAERYRVDKATALADFQDFVERIQTLLSTPDLDPVAYLDFDRIAPHSTDLPAPLRIDCALTYRLPEHTQATYAPVKRADRELTTAEWQSILDTAWRAGVPHVTFTGGEATLRDDLPALIAHAEKNGQVCGLLTDGLRLADSTYFNVLLQTGLDHLLFLLQPDNPTSWAALETVMPQDIFTTVHLTLTPENSAQAANTLERLARLKVTSLSLSLQETSLRAQYADLRDQAAALGLTLRFDLPVPYSAQNPVAFETEEDNLPSGAGKAWLYVEPDGDVLPAQGMADHVLGNALTDDWQAFLPH